VEFVYEKLTESSVAVKSDKYIKNTIQQPIQLTPDSLTPNQIPDIQIPPGQVTV